MRKNILSTLACCMMACAAWAQNTGSIPMQLVNNSVFKDSEIYVGIIGQDNGKWVYYDLGSNSATNTALKDLNSSTNTLHKTAGDQGYADVFTTLDKIKDKTIYIGHTYGCRMFVGFRSPMYLHAFDTGYAGADLNNPSDPNASVRWENLEFTYDNYNVVFANTTRVDCFQYPMGVEVYGTSTSNNAYMKAGEIANYATISGDFQNEFKGTDFASCYKNSIKSDNLGGIIVNPSKVASIRDNYFTDEINNVWTYFKSHTLNVDLGSFGKWTGKVGADNYLTLQRTDGASVRIAQPSSKDIIEGSGTMASGSDNEKQFEAQLCGAINRGAIDLTEDEQSWQDTSKFFRDGTVYNPYVKFLHRTDLTYNGYTYAFSYDDTGDNSATVATKDPDHLVVTIGGYATDPGVEPENPTPGDDQGDDAQPGTSYTAEDGLSGGGVTKEGLKYTWTLTTSGTEATVTFKCLNSDDFIGLVPPFQRDMTNGDVEKPQGETAVYTYGAGQTFKFACKWLYAGHDTFSDTFSYTMPGGSSDDDNPTEPVDDNPYDYNSSCNLWNSANVTYDFYYAPEWNQIANPTVTADNGTYTITFPTATTDQWQAQTWLTTDIETNISNKYDFSVTLTSTNEIPNAVVKLYVKGNDGVFYFTDNINLKANTPVVVKHQAMPGQDMTNVSLLLDFGGNPANTVVTIDKPVLKESGCTPTGINSVTTDKAEADGTWYDLSGRNLGIRQPAAGIYIHNGKKVVVK